MTFQSVFFSFFFFFYNYSGVTLCGCLFLSECVLEMLRICITCLVLFMLLTLLLVQHFGLCVCLHFRVFVHGSVCRCKTVMNM